MFVREIGAAAGSQFADPDSVCHDTLELRDPGGKESDPVAEPADESRIECPAPIDSAVDLVPPIAGRPFDIRSLHDLAQGRRFHVDRT
ncbi:MAG: hypothetical protein Fues2KO_13250 [Fuerstiella sp.]